MIRSSVATLLSFGFALGSAVSAQAATLTYDFSGTAGTQPAGPPAWSSTRTVTSGSGSTFSLNGTGGYTNSMSATATTGQVIDYGGFSLTDRAAGSDFSITTSFTSDITAASSTWNVQAGIRFLASSVNAESTDSWYQLLVFSANSPGSTFGRIALEKRWFNGTAWATATLYESSAVATGISGLGLDSGGTFTLTLNGTYGVGGDLTLGFTVANSNGTTRTNSVVDAVGGATGGPHTGSFFGVRDRIRNFSGSTLSMTTTFDNFNMTYTTVPEPSTMILAGLGLGLVCLRRRRSRMRY